MAIEIDSNTIIKLLARRGSDLERQNIILSEGEFGYVVDLKRLYIGDGVTPGGIPTSVKFHNTTADITNIPGSVEKNDLVYKSDTKEIYKLLSGDGSQIGDWELISGPTLINTDNATISASSTGTLFVREISGNQISSAALGPGLEKFSNTVALSGSISIDSIELKSNTLTLPSNITFKSGLSQQSFTLPTVDGFNKYHLVTDGNGNLSFEPADVVSAGTVFMSDTSIDVGTVIFSAVSSYTEPVGWLICDGRELSGADYPELSAAIGTTYGGDDIVFSLPNFMGGGMQFGATQGSVDVGTQYNILTSEDASPIFAQAGIWLIRYKPIYAITTQININEESGLIAETNSQPTTAITLSGAYDLSIDTGSVGTGNLAVVKGYKKARSNNIYTFTNPGSAVYIVSDNIYKIKVTATGGGGVGYTKYDEVYCRANGTQGGAGGTVVAYIDVEPGETYVIDVGEPGVALRDPDYLPVQFVSAGEGGTSSFSISSSPEVISPLLEAPGAFDGSLDPEFDYLADWAGGGYARGGFRGGRPNDPTEAQVSGFYILSGGDGGQTFERSADGPGAASIWGSGPAPGGGGSGYAKKDALGFEIAKAGNGIVIVEEL